MATITSITVVVEQTTCDGCSVVLTGLFGYDVEDATFCADCVVAVAPHTIAA